MAQITTSVAILPGAYPESAVAEGDVEKQEVAIEGLCG